MKLPIIITLSLLFVSGCVELEPTWYADRDGDGYGNVEESINVSGQPYGHVDNFDDCDDTLDFIFPGAVETYNGFDNNCDGVVDGGETLKLTSIAINNPIVDLANESALSVHIEANDVFGFDMVRIIVQSIASPNSLNDYGYIHLVGETTLSIDIDIPINTQYLGDGPFEIGEIHLSSVTGHYKELNPDNFEFINTFEVIDSSL